MGSAAVASSSGRPGLDPNSLEGRIAAADIPTLKIMAADLELRLDRDHIVGLEQRARARGDLHDIKIAIEKQAKRAAEQQVEAAAIAAVVRPTQDPLTISRRFCCVCREGSCRLIADRGCFSARGGGRRGRQRRHGRGPGRFRALPAVRCGRGRAAGQVSKALPARPCVLMLPLPSFVSLKKERDHAFHCGLSFKFTKTEPFDCGLSVCSDELIAALVHRGYDRKESQALSCSKAPFFSNV